MKTSKFSLSAVGLFLAVCLFFTACKKDPEDPEPTPTPTPTPVAPQEPFKIKNATINYRITGEEVGTMDVKLVFENYGKRSRGEMSIEVPGLGSMAVVLLADETAGKYYGLIPLLKRYIVFDMNPVEDMFLFQGDDEGFTYAAESTKEQRTIAGKVCNVYSWEEDGMVYQEGGWSRIILYSDGDGDTIEAQTISESAPNSTLFDLPADYTPMELPEFKSMVGDKSSKILSFLK